MRVIKYFIIVIFAINCIVLNTYALFLYQNLNQNVQKQINDELAKYENSIKNDNKNEALTSLNKIAHLYWQNGLLNEATDYFIKSENINITLGNNNALKVIYDNLGLIFTDLNQNDKALSYFIKSQNIKENLSNKYDHASGHINLATAYANLGKYNEAIKQLEDGLKISLEIQDKKLIRINYGKLADYYEKIGDSKKSLEYFNFYSSFDKLVKTEETKEVVNKIAQKAQIAEAEKNEKVKELNKKNTELEITEKNLEVYKKISLDREVQIELLKRDKKIQELTIKEQEAKLEGEKIFRNSIIGLTFFIVLITFLVLNSYRMKVRDNKLLKTERDNLAIEKRRSENLLLNILPAQIAAELKFMGKANVRQYDMVSVLFTDVKDFSKIAKKYKADELVEELNEYFTKFDDIVEKYNLEKIKTIGDSYMCAGGIPVPDNIKHINIILAGIEMQNLFQELNNKKLDGKIKWEIRVGIHTGSLIAAVVGKKKFIYDIWGDTVNTASRMESSCEPGKVNISGATFEVVKDFFDCTHRGRISAKNIGETDMYFVENIKPELSVNGKGIVPNDKFQEKLASFDINFEVENYIET